MNTQLPMLNIAGTQTPSRVTPPQADSFAAEVPFQQVLNKEVDNRNTGPQAKPADTIKDAPAEPSTAPAAADASAPPAKSDDAKSASSGDKKDDDKTVDNFGEIDTAASAQMLALVATVGQMAAQPVTKQASGKDMDVLADDKDKKTIGLSGANDKATLSLLQSDDKSKTSGKDGGSTLSAVQDDGKGITEDKAAIRPAAEKKTSESPVAVKSAKAEQQAGPDARLARAVPETTTKAAEAPPQPTAATIVPALQQAMSLNQQAALSGQAVQRLTPAVGSQGWDQAVGQKLQWMVSGGLQSASLTLNPPDLGPLQVVLHVNNQQADATFITAQPEVKHALEAAMPKLREMMDQAGIQLGQATVNTGTPNQQQGAGNSSQHARAGSGANGFGSNGDAADDIQVAAVPGPVVSSGQGLVDTFA